MHSNIALHSIVHMPSPSLPLYFSFKSLIIDFQSLFLQIHDSFSKSIFFPRIISSDVDSFIRLF